MGLGIQPAIGVGKEFWNKVFQKIGTLPDLRILEMSSNLVTAHLVV